MEKKEIEIITKENLENRIYFIRGQKVMLDRDLAEIYGYETKIFNRQVQRNIEKFEEDFMFRLTEKEAYILRCQNGTSSLIDEHTNEEDMNLRSQIVTSNWGGQRYLPYAFTEQGIYMLMTVLRGELAIKQSKALIRLFKSMKDYISENRDFVTTNDLKLIEYRTERLEENSESVNKRIDEMNDDLKKVMDNFVNEDSYKHFLIMDGKKLKARMTNIIVIKYT